ncbi:MAG: DNA mismatch repair endonuclease MutL [Ignavibacteria bacterium]|nr:DNA mismatch repair endonuclease MutL [Ignavibacteria bacterium]
MNKILVLPENIASKIAAGEVVQRPESVVKELIENSIDSGADNITLIIKDAGKSLIQVIDNGVGMSKEDAKLAFYRHSTSKIKELSDLDNILTLGFRGEALYSIAAVSRIEMKTRTETQELGTQLIFEGGELIEESIVNCERGTSISVKNLFFSVPARRNFLKTNATEFKHIHDTFQRISLSFCEKRFSFIDDEKLVYDMQPSSLEKRIQFYFGESQLDSILPVSFTSDTIEVSGYIGAPHFAKRNKGEQFIFLNERYISNRSIAHAVYRGYENILEKGEFPFFILFLKLDPKKIDVNVHPSKLEVKFDNEQLIYSSILVAVKEALTSKDISPNLEFSIDNSLSEKTRFTKPSLDKNSFIAKEIYSFKENYKKTQEHDVGFSSRSKSKVDIIDETNTLITAFSIDDESKFEEAKLPSRVVWQLHNKYILTPIKNGLMLIDQHVAHERVLYEKALESIESNLPFSQQLLFPQTIELARPDFELVTELKDLLQRIGFEIKEFGKSAIIIQGIPHDIKSGKEKEILLEILELYREYERAGLTNEKDKIAKSFACKSAIKAGEILSEKEMLSLIDNLFLTKVPYVCPHGRPVFIKLSIDELDRRFGRTVK